MNAIGWRLRCIAAALWLFSAPAYNAAEIADLVASGDTQALAAAVTSGNINRADKRGNTPLHYAAAGAYAEMLALLLQRGADVNAVNAQYGTTPLHELARTTSRDRRSVVACARALLDRNANADVSDKHGETPLVAAARYGNAVFVRVLLDARSPLATSESVDKALAVAREAGRYEVVNVLAERGVKSDAGLQVGLLNAAGAGDYSMVEQSHAAGASIDAQNAAAEGPLYLAVANGHTEVANYLLDHGAAVNAVTADGRTAVYAACDAGHADLVELLLARGADINLASATHGNALNAAASRERVDLANRLIAKGAVPAQVSGTGEQAFGSGFAWLLFAEHHAASSSPAATAEGRRAARELLEIARAKFTAERIQFEETRSERQRSQQIATAIATAIAGTVVAATDAAMAYQQQQAQRQLAEIAALKGATSYSDYQARLTAYERVMVNPSTRLPYRIDIADPAQVNSASMLGLDLIIKEYERRIALTEHLLAQLG